MVIPNGGDASSLVPSLRSRTRVSRRDRVTVSFGGCGNGVYFVFEDGEFVERAIL